MTTSFLIEMLSISEDIFGFTWYYCFFKIMPKWLWFEQAGSCSKNVSNVCFFSNFAKHFDFNTFLLWLSKNTSMQPVGIH